MRHPFRRRPSHLCRLPLLLLPLLLTASSLSAQVNTTRVRFVLIDPSGACTASYITLNLSTKNMMGCVSSVWSTINGAGGTSPSTSTPVTNFFVTGYNSGTGTFSTARPTAANVLNAVDTTQTYSNPSWITALGGANVNDIGAMINTPLSPANNTGGTCATDDVGDCTTAIKNCMASNSKINCYFPKQAGTIGRYSFTATASTWGIANSNGRITMDPQVKIRVHDGGNGYAFLQWKGDGRAYGLSTVTAGAVTSITTTFPFWTLAGRNYSAAPTITFLDNPFCPGFGAAATTTIDGNGSVNSITVTNGGLGYIKGCEPIPVFSAAGGPITLDHFSYEYAAPATVRNSTPTVEFSGTTDLLCIACSASYSPGMSFMNSNTFNTHYIDTVILGSTTNTLLTRGSDGWHCASCVNPVLYGGSIDGSGDDGAALTNQYGYQNGFGGWIGGGLKVRHTTADGVRIEGVKGWTVDGVSVYDVAASCYVFDTGVQVTGVGSYSGARKGIVTNVFGDNCGNYANNGTTSNGMGLEFYGKDTGDIKITNAHMTHARVHGISATNEVGSLDTANSTFNENASGGLVLANAENLITNVKAVGNYSKNVLFNGIGTINTDGIYTEDGNQDSRIATDTRALSIIGTTGKYNLRGLAVTDNFGFLVADSLRVTTPGTTYSNAGGTVNIGGLTCTFNPVLYFFTDGAGAVQTLALKYKGAGCTGTPTFTFPGGDGTAAMTGFLNSNLRGVDATLTTAGSGYSNGSFTFPVYLSNTITSGCYSTLTNPDLIVTVAANVVSSVAWATPLSKCDPAAALGVVTLAGGGCTASCGTATLAVHAALASTGTNNVFQESATNTLNLFDPQWFLYAASEVKSYSVADTLNIYQQVLGIPAYVSLGNVTLITGNVYISPGGGINTGSTTTFSSRAFALHRAATITGVYCSTGATNGNSNDTVVHLMRSTNATATSSSFTALTFTMVHGDVAKAYSDTAIGHWLVVAPTDFLAIQLATITDPTPQMLECGITYVN